MQIDIPRLLSSIANRATDQTAQSGDLSIGQQIVAAWESSMIAEPCELAAAIDEIVQGVWHDGFEAGQNETST